MKTLLLDIETTPNISYTWGLFDQTVSLAQLEEPSRVICVGWKWLGQKRVGLLSEWQHGHEGMVQGIWDLLDEADVVMTYNGKRFDIPHLNREFVEAGLVPPAPYEQIDLFQTVRSKFRFVSNKLEHVSDRLGLDGKIEHEGFRLWLDVMDGKAEARRKMTEYCKRDVVLLEELYDLLKAWITNHPNQRLYGKPDCCPTCGTDEPMHKDGFRRTKVSVFQRWRCNICGAVHQSTIREKGAGAQVRQVVGS